LLFNLWTGRVALSDAVWGAVAGYMVLWCIYWLFKLLTKKEGMGYGDFKLLAALGAWLGWQQVPMVLLFSSFVGALFGIALIVLARHGRNQPLPYGPYLAASGWIAFVSGDAIMKWYWHGA
jgi:leader peptidase (prepilin peptidase)/N-methyltransferase